MKALPKTKRSSPEKVNPLKGQDIKKGKVPRQCVSTRRGKAERKKTAKVRKLTDNEGDREEDQKVGKGNGPLESEGRPKKDKEQLK